MSGRSLQPQAPASSLLELLFARRNPLGPLYKHALCLNPYYRDSQSGSLGLAIFPTTGLEYIAAALEPHVEQVTLLDLRLPGPMRNLERLKKFIAEEIDLLCVSINWEYQFPEVCELVNSLPREVFTVVGGETGHRLPGGCVRGVHRS